MGGEMMRDVEKAGIIAFLSVWAAAILGSLAILAVAVWGGIELIQWVTSPAFAALFH
jgi:hypothetical protein